jgi:hypothetical protein
MTAFVVFFVVGVMVEVVDEDEDEAGSKISDDLRGGCR